MTLIVTHPVHFRSEELQGLPWAYVDGKISIYRQLEQRLGQQQRLISARDFDARAAALHGRFIEWADGNVGIEDKREWIVTPLHRNPFGNDIQLHLTWLTLLAEYAGQRDVLVLTESGAFLDTLRANPVFGVTKVSFSSAIRFRREELRKKLRALASMTIRASQIIVGIVVARFCISSQHLHRFAAIDVLIERYLHERDIRSNGTYADPYAPGLLELLSVNNLRAAYLAHRYLFSLAGVRRLFLALRDSPVPILPFERFVRFRDCAFAFSSSVRYAFKPLPPVAPFGILSVAALVRAERVTAALHAFTGLLHLRLPQRLAQANIAPRLMLDWFENQQLDRALSLAIAEHPNGPRLAGFRQYAMFPNCSSLYVSDRAVRQGAAPVDCYVSGRKMAQQLSLYDKTTTYHVVPAFRYAYLHDAPLMADEALADDRILIILTHSEEENYGILSNTFEALRSLAVSPRMTIRIRPHPNVSVPTTILLVAAEWPWIGDYAAIEWSAGGLAEDFSVSCLATTSGSSAALEALCRGVPVVIIGRPAGLSMNPLDGVDAELWQEIFDGAEMVAVLRRWLPRHPLPRAERLRRGNAVRDLFFEPNSAAAASRLLAAVAVGGVASEQSTMRAVCLSEN